MMNNGEHKIWNCMGSNPSVICEIFSQSAKNQKQFTAAQNFAEW